jgi:hypothetical protein
VHAVHHDGGADGVGTPGDRSHVGDRAGQVARSRDGHQTGALAYNAVIRFWLEIRRRQLWFDPANGGIDSFGPDQPWTDVRVVVESRNDDFVPCPPGCRQRLRQAEDQARRVRPEDDAVRVHGADQVSYRRACFGHVSVGPDACGEGAAMIADPRSVGPGGRLDHRVWHLGAGRSVQVGPTVGQSRVVRSDRGDVEGRGAHLAFGFFGLDAFGGRVAT